MRHLATAALFAVTLLSGGQLLAAAPHDGNWSVVIITEKGDCDRAYRYPLAVSGGHVRYTGQAGANVQGTVSPTGAVRVAIRMGNKGADGTGHLSGSGGTGTWHGAGGGASCSGRWEAEKR
jgi:hypothetical protein